MADTTKAIETLRCKLQFIRFQANDLQSDFEICYEINLAVITALNALEELEIAMQATDVTTLAA